MRGTIVAAALRCFALYGVAKTTVEDVAQAAGCSRATLYRHFPSKQALLSGVVEAEVRRVAGDVEAVASGADTLDDLLVGVLTTVAREFESHEVLQRVLTFEPEVALPHLAFERGNRVLAVGSLVISPHLSRFLTAEAAAPAGEWLCRVAFTYLLSPSEHVSLTDEASVRRLVRTFVLPGMEHRPAVPAPLGSGT